MERKFAWVLLLAAALGAAGCKKKASGEARPEEPARSEPVVPVVAGPSVDAASMPESPAPPAFQPGELRVNVPLGGLGVTASFPENVSLEVEGTTATLAADGFPMVKISVAPLTVENARLTITIDGRKQPAPGSTFDGGTRILQTDCLLVECTVEQPPACDAELDRLSDAVCESVVALPAPTEGYVRNVRSASFSWSGRCTDADRALGTPLGELAELPEHKDAVERCWREAVAANVAWLAAQGRIRLRWAFGKTSAATFEVKLEGLEGDTAGLQACAATALAPIEGRLPEVGLSADCRGASLAVAYDLDHRLVCSSAPSAPVP